jgi:AAA ATPase domain
MGVQVPMDRGGPKLLGRTVECEKLDELLSAVRSGRSGALVVRGEAGCGKSALLDYVAARSDGCRLDRVVGVESEMELPYAKLHQLCMPVLDRVERLPTPQREALETSFGLSDGRQPDPFLVGLAVLTLLSDVAATQPLVCLVDDAHWLDHGSALVLAFVARRLGAESILLLFAERDDGALQELTGLPELQLDGLSQADARELLSSSSLGPLDERVRDRIVAESRGNPLALLELPRGVSSASLAGGFALPESLPLEQDRGKLSTQGRPATRGNAAAAARRCCRASRRSNASLASGCGTRHSGRGGWSGRGGRPDRGRVASRVPPSAPAVGHLPRGVA